MCENNQHAAALHRIAERDKKPYSPPIDNRSQAKISFAKEWAHIQAHATEHTRVDAQKALIERYRREYPKEQW